MLWGGGGGDEMVASCACVVFLFGVRVSCKGVEMKEKKREKTEVCKKKIFVRS